MRVKSSSHIFFFTYSQFGIPVAIYVSQTGSRISDSETIFSDNDDNDDDDDDDDDEDDEDDDGDDDVDDIKLTSNLTIA
ncbi:hypothetical protein P5V15_005176 [Pogonomyrmex californicus]